MLLIANRIHNCKMIKELKSHLIVLKFNRIWVDNEEGFKTITWLIRLICAVNMFVVTSGMIIEIYFARENVITVTYSIALIGATGPSSAKFYCLIKWRPVFKSILRDLESGLARKYKIDGNEKAYMAEAENMIKRYLRKYVLGTFAGLLGLIGIPFMKKLVILLKLVPEGPVGTPEPTWTPFDIDDNFNYALVCFLQGYHLLSIWALWVGSDVLFSGIVFHLCGHFNIISDRISHWVSSRSKRYEIPKGNKEREELGKIIEYHSEVLKLDSKFKQSRCQHF